MAIVYLAEDLRHAREVALKVLKPDLAAVVGADRFLAEIKTTAHLNHPHILPLYDSGEADGFLFYVMPKVAGESLRDRLDREAQLPVGDAVRIATAVAHALDYAHRQGVIHRDIKPENILFQDDEPLVTDFGIALAVGEAGGNRLTETGLSLGTPYYMSPEQATGDPILGPPTDIYALGCVLYEMLVGEPPYQGKTAQAVLGKIITAKPASAGEHRPTVPAHVDAALRCALEKLPADRFLSANEFLKALQDPGFRHGEGGTAVQATGPWRGIAVALSGMTVIVTLAAAWGLLRPRPPGQVLRVSLSSPEEMTRGGGFALLPDGSALVYAGPSETGRTQLWLRYMDDLQAKPLSGTEGANYPAPSPDGGEVAFQANGLIRVVPIRGGVPRTLADSALGYPFWGVDGYVYFVNNAYSASRVPAQGGPVELVAGLEPGEAGKGVSYVLPGGDVVLMEVLSSRSLADCQVRALRLATGEVTPITKGLFASLTPTGHLLYVNSDSTLMAAPFDQERLVMTGPAIPVVEQVSGNGVGYFFISLSSTGMLLYRAGGGIGQAQPEWVERDGRSRPIDPSWTVGANPTFSSLSLSPEGSRLALSVAGGGSWNLWVKELDLGPMSPLTFEGSDNRRPWWTPDGESVNFISNRSGAFGVWSKRADGSDQADPVLAHERGIWQATSSHDGTWIVYRVATNTTGGDPDIFAIRPGRDTVGTPLLTTGFWEAAPALSPDDRWLAYISNESGRREVYVRPFPDADSAKWRVSRDGGSEPLWAHSGRELFYRNEAGDMVAAQVVTGNSFSVGEQVILFSASEYLAGLLHPMYDVSPDDQRFVMLRSLGDPEPGALILELNFLEELKRRVDG